MAFRHLISNSAVLPAIVAGGAILLHPKNAFAETPDAIVEPRHRKPIYDDLPASISPGAIAAAPSTPPTTNIPSNPNTVSPTPTDRLATQVRLARLFLQKQAVKAEDATNQTMTKVLNLEHSFTSTVASLAPPKESEERLLPNGLYVLVAAMAGSILVRNRNILLRLTVPPLIGISAAYTIIPRTTNNVADLIWTYEKKYPVVADTHLRVKERVSRFVETGIAHSQMGFDIAEQKVGEVRKAVEEWVSKGR